MNLAENQGGTGKGRLGATSHFFGLELGPGDLLLAASLLSGVAGVVNQVVWQRALKIFLGGGEAICAMVVVLVFMLGLGIGALLAAQISGRLRNPLSAFAVVELSLAGVNLVIAAILAQDITASLYSFQQAAVSLGISLRIAYLFVAAGVLLIPCVLMGMTMALASEAGQRKFGIVSPAWVEHLFFANTLGAFFGALLSGYYLIPFLGQTRALLVAILANAVTGCLLLTMNRLPVPVSSGVGEGVPAKVPEEREPAPVLGNPDLGLRSEEILSFFLGFSSLAYEMYLFRITALAREPLPYNFASVLAFFLFYWAAGVMLAAWIPSAIVSLLLVCALVVGCAPFVHHYERFVAVDFVAWGGDKLYYIPCLVFGLLYGQLLTRLIDHWGRDVGRFSGLNTLGCCLGIVAMTVFGLKLHATWSAWCISGLLFLLWFYGAAVLSGFGGLRERIWMRRGFLAAGAVALVVLAISNSRQPLITRDTRIYSGADGVIEIRETGDLFWDGLWHSKLSNGRDHIGTSNWMLAVVPWLAHPGIASQGRGLVIGMGTGITLGTLAKSRMFSSVDSYEINHDLKRVLVDFATGTLNVLDNPRIRLMWQDGRSGLALNDDQYDVITQAPTYLKQAGSAILLSREYFELVKRRLLPGGVFCVYANSHGRKAQNLAVEKTVASVFPHYRSFRRGYMFLASDRPIDFSTAHLAARLAEDDPLAAEIRGVASEARISRWLDPPRTEWKLCPWRITDDHPIVEYPDILEDAMPGTVSAHSETAPSP